MRIAILGLGRMGTPMARNLIEVGNEVVLYNRTRARAEELAGLGARLADSVADAVREAHVALTMVTGDAAEEALSFGPGGLLASLASGAVHLCMSSIGVEASLRLAEAHEAAGQGYVAAPVLGGPAAAALRQLWILAAGPERQVNRCLAILEMLGRGITRVGTRPELAHALKLGADALTVTLVEALAEVLAFGAKAGTPPAEYLRILNLGLFRSPLVDAFGGFIVRRDHQPANQTLDLAARSLESLVRTAGDLQVTMPMTGPLLQLLRSAQAAGLGDLDLTVLAMVRRLEAGLEAPAADQPAPAPAPPAPQATVPSIPQATAPSTPQAKVPSTPQATAPPAPQAKAPSIPQATAPSTPQATVPSTPRATVPSTPQATAPSTPQAKVPSTPQATAPSTPQATAPSTPQATAPSTPQATAPSTPQATAPSTPQATAPPTPQATAPSTPQATAPPAPQAKAPSSPPVPVPAVPPAAARPGETSVPPGPETSTAPFREAEDTGLPDLGRITHFEAGGGAVWAWVAGQRHRTPWRNLDEVELALEDQILWARIQRHILLNPGAVKEVIPRFGGRARVTLTQGPDLLVSRTGMPRLKLLLGI